MDARLLAFHLAMAALAITTIIDVFAKRETPLLAPFPSLSSERRTGYPLRARPRSRALTDRR